MSWSLVEVDKVTADLLDALFDNEIAGIRAPGFIPAATAAEVAAAVPAQGLAVYRDVEPRIGRIGITQFEYQGDKAGYFALAAAANRERRRMFGGHLGLLELVLDHIRAAWPHPVGLAREADGAEYFAGLVRVIGTALLHCDWARHDASEWSIGSVSGQVTWNIYCSRPDSGGSTVVYNRPWTPDAEDYRVAGSYGYHPDLVRGVASVRFAPNPTDLVLFNSRNFHLVEPGRGATPRVSVSSFIGRGPDRAAIAWS